MFAINRNIFKTFSTDIDSSVILRIKINIYYERYLKNNSIIYGHAYRENSFEEDCFYFYYIYKLYSLMINDRLDSA